MPVKKQNTKTKKTTEPVSVLKPVPESIQESVPISMCVQESVPASIQEPVQESVQEPVTKQMKPGRTIVIKPKSDGSLDLSKFDNLNGLVSKSEIKNNDSLFLTFDTIANSEVVYSLFSSEYNVKYCYYKVFFTLSNNVDSNNYENTKTEILNFIQNNTDCNMLYCKFYRKDSSYMNCGDLIVDTIDGMKKLISKESSLKQFKTENLSGTFYRFNNSKYKTQNTFHSTH